MRRMFGKALLISLLLCTLSVGGQARAGTLLQPPSFQGNFRLFAVAQSGDTVAYAWATQRGGTLSVQGTISQMTQFSRHTVTGLAVALVDPNTPVVAWADRAGVHSGIWRMGPLGFPAWFYDDHGKGTTPQLLTNPVRLIFFAPHGVFTCAQWTNSAWQAGCSA